MSAAPIPGGSSTGSESPSVLVVDDDEGCRRAVARVLAADGLRVEAVSTLAEAREILTQSRPSAVVVELRVEDGEGVEALEAARCADPFIGRVMLTGAVDFLAVQDAVNRGAVHAFFTKPWDNETLVRGVRGVIEQCRLARENHEMALRLRDQNRALEALVAERTRALERAKRELQMVFDAWEDPLALVTPDFRVLRANRAWAEEAALDVREAPGRFCHEALFRRVCPCENCPVQEGVRIGVVEGRDSSTRWSVWVRPLSLEEPGVLCWYRRTENL